MLFKARIRFVAHFVVLHVRTSTYDSLPVHLSVGEIEQKIIKITFCTVYQSFTPCTMADIDSIDYGCTSSGNKK